MHNTTFRNGIKAQKSTRNLSALLQVVEDSFPELRSCYSIVHLCSISCNLNFKLLQKDGLLPFSDDLFCFAKFKSQPLWI